jgi:UDP:flavonoid glycosyltransferase YjiC (YdhE family)
MAATSRSDLPPHVFAIDYAPYAWLFPRMAAVVHHGGSGTTAAGLRAGVPALVVPFLFDQHFWGRRLAELGVAPRPLPFRKLTADRLAQAIGAAVSDDGMLRRAAALGHKIRAEKGLEAAVAIIQRVTGSR